MKILGTAVIAVRKMGWARMAGGIKRTGVLPVKKQRKGEIMDTCVSCGGYVPEGRQVCLECEYYGAPQPSIKDSGQRREFPTGAVRDIVAGKGRYDLLLWDVTHNLAIWVEQGIRIDLVPWEAVRELTIHCDEGAKKF